MKRPVNVSQLLANLSSQKRDVNAKGIGGDKLIKPKFLTKGEREDFISSSEVKSSAVEIENRALNVRKVDKKRERDENVTGKYSNGDTERNEKPAVFKRSKFQFGWSEDEDTLNNYNPIAKTKVVTLLNGNTDLDSVEETYMGKHWQDKTLQEMTERDWRILREDFDITTKGGSIENPIRNWHESNILKKDMVDIIVDELKFKEPTPIQRVAIPNVCKLKNRDFLGVASTGSGKTLAFIIPILIKMSNAPPRPLVLKTIEGPKALILAPTRELAQQIQTDAQRITDLWNIKNPHYSCKVVSIVGGHSIEGITFQLSEGCDILVATPGRLIDSLENHVVAIKQVDTLVLDEADKMIDMGFEEQVTTILTKLDSTAEGTDRKQTMMFTATMSPSVERIANGYLRKPAYATIGEGEASIPQIQQIVRFMASEEQRFKSLKSVLTQFESPIIIFITYKRTADWLAQKFYNETSFKVTILHGSKSQEQRELSLKLLRTGKVQIMIATNVAARGLDIPNVSLVVNFQISKSFDDYVHRIGRTGRAGKKGTAITYLGEDENPQTVEELYQYVRVHNPTNKNEFDNLLKSKYNVGRNQMQEVLY